MRKTIKVAKWEIKRNLKNKSFVISLFITPILFLIFFLLGNFSGNSEVAPKMTKVKVFVNDQLNAFPALEEAVNAYNLPFELVKTGMTEDKAAEQLKNSRNTAFLSLNEKTLTTGSVPVYTTKEISPSFSTQLQLLQEPLKVMQMKHLGLSPQQLAAISKGIVFKQTAIDKPSETGGDEGETHSLKRMIPAGFAGIIFLSIVFTGMMIFQSASQEKKDKIAEIILSSITPRDLMQGKIIGYFILGMIQVAIFLVLMIPAVLWKIDFPIFHYLLVPELILFICLALLGYLLFAAIFVGVGATMTDISNAGNFQGFVIMLPFLSFIFIGPVSSDPSGTWAQIGSYLPFTSPAVLIMRLAILDEWPWIEIIISLAILIISVFIFMRLAGKIFKVGILLYGKNATPKEILKWMRQ